MKPEIKFPIIPKGNFISGRYGVAADRQGEIVLKSPAHLGDTLGTVPFSYQDVERAVEAGFVAFQLWRKTSLETRIHFLKKYQAAVRAREEVFIETLAREIGKPKWEAKTEVAAMVNKIDITINDSLKLVADIQLPQIMDGTSGVCRYKPLGVMAVLGPFNFPGHLPNGHIVPALLMGNTVVFKPSEKAPFTGQLMADCFEEAGLPEGVFNLLQGEKEVGRRLAVHEKVAGVLFTGSYEVGTRLKQDTLQQHWKLLALEMGGKNAALVLDDCDFDFTVRETLVGGFITAGQRCSATSRILVQDSLFDKFVDTFHKKAKGFKIGHPFSDPFMGPLIEEASCDRYLKFLGTASREGYEILMRGKRLELESPGHYVTPSICTAKTFSLAAAQKSVFFQTEIFAPAVSIVGFSTLEEAVALANATQYGLVASVFTGDRTRFEKAWMDLDAGIINWNKGTVGASSKLPFGGTKKSGNHFPTALSSTLYCSYPVASLEAEKATGSATQYPGLNY